MELLLNDVLHLTDEEIGNSKIEFNMKAGKGGQPFIDRWLKHTQKKKKQLELVRIVRTGVGILVIKEISHQGNGYLVFQE